MGRLLRRFGSAAARHKWSLLIAATAVAIGSVTVTVFAVQDGASFLGTTAAGSHQWWQDFGTTDFCERCHVGIATELDAGPHVSAGLSSCTACHSPSGPDEHSAAPAKCADCHPGAAGDLTSGDAHQGITVDLGETDPTMVSWTCKACHTHVEVTLEAIPRGPLDLIMGN